ncbi:hypothetical protein N7527_005115 [Penicillium freii]|nr:hypothetical protein N7527_005115 [Penicillium freii]
MPPVRSSPRKLRRPVLRQRTWCVTCLRVSVKERSEGNPVALRPFSMHCFAETYDGKNCRHCNGLHKPCVPESVEGNSLPLALTRAENRDVGINLHRAAKSGQNQGPKDGISGQIHSTRTRK